MNNKESAPLYSPTRRAFVLASLCFGMSLLCTAKSCPIHGQAQESCNINASAKASSTASPITAMSRNVTTPLGTVKGQLLCAQDANAAPTIVFSHGLGGCGANFLAEALEVASMGINMYLFDYIGGSESSASGGSYQQMSVETEKEQLEAIVEATKTWVEVDPKRLFLAGHSQGGLLSTMVAAERSDIAGVILFAPALNLGDMMRTQYTYLDNVGNTFTFLMQRLGRVYATDIWDVTETNVEAAYYGTSIVFHGWSDTVIDPQVSVRAKQAWGDRCSLHMLQGIDHFTVVEPNTAIAKQIHLYVTTNSR